MNRRQMIKGATAAAVVGPAIAGATTPGLAFAPDCPEVNELDKPYSTEPKKSVRDPIGTDVYVEYGVAGSGKTTRLVETALRRGAWDGTMAAIFSSEVHPREFLEIRKRIINDQRRPQAERDFLARCREDQFMVFSGPDLEELNRQFWTQWQLCIKHQSPRPKIRFYFDNWGQFLKMPDKVFPGGYYTSPASHSIHDAVIVPTTHPEFQRKLHEAAGNINVHLGVMPIPVDYIKTDLVITRDQSIPTTW